MGRQADKWTDKQTYKQAERCLCLRGQTVKQADKADKQMETQTGILAGRHFVQQTNSCAGTSRQTIKHTGRQAKTESNRQSGKHRFQVNKLVEIERERQTGRDSGSATIPYTGIVIGKLRGTVCICFVQYFCGSSASTSSCFLMVLQW
jgi:hypothetical protein